MSTQAADLPLLALIEQGAPEDILFVFDGEAVTRADFLLAAKWLARQAANAGDALSALLAGPAPDDADNGICIGYRDGRDR